jgi:hypothetical protein|uniref:Uncharacterized protein n=2 Tax=Picea TaxID=3328 RepID=A0A101M4I6_PICGL|nr:hypothetical protein ABT39_MTgene706 [Picea glauca]QHR90215.1 hypothetical protein Q903MT_gene4238 [Picea sitchensis]
MMFGTREAVNLETDGQIQRRGSDGKISTGSVTAIGNLYPVSAGVDTNSCLGTASVSGVDTNSCLGTARVSDMILLVTGRMRMNGIV